MRLPRTVAFGVFLGVCFPSWGQPIPVQPASLRPSAAAPAAVGLLTMIVADQRVQNIPYNPQPGDLAICDDFNKFRHFVYKIAGTAAPTHICMVIANTDGKPALLELTGPRLITSKVVIMDVEDRFNGYPGDVMVRRLREPLTAEQSRELTDFAYSQAGKGFALGRVILQGTPVNARSGLRRTLFGKTHYDRTRWFCSEMVVAACCKAQIFDPQRMLANATYPRDLAFDETIDLSSIYHPAVMWSPGESKRVGPLVSKVSRPR